MADPVFLSYSWDDQTEVDELDILLRLRGVPVWRDRREMRWGGYNEEVVRHAIRHGVAGFALYLTPAALEGSWFIPKVELRAMDERRARDPTFFTGAIFRGYGATDGTKVVHERTGIDVGATLGSVIEGNELQAGLRAAANAILREYVRSAWRSGPAVARVETRDPLPTEESSVVHLSLSPPLEHDPDRYDVAVWADQVVPALDDLQHALHAIELATPACERVLEISGAAHLSAALALGYSFRETTRWRLRVHHFGDVWETGRVEGDLDGWECPPAGAGSDPTGDLVVMVHVSADVTNAVRASAGGGPSRAELHFRAPGGPGKLGLRPAAANAAAAGIARAIRAARQDYAPAETRLYVAGPWPFAVLLGWHLGSVGPVVMHEATVARDSYRVSCVLT